MSDFLDSYLIVVIVIIDPSVFFWEVKDILDQGYSRGLFNYYNDLRIIFSPNKLYISNLTFAGTGNSYFIVVSGLNGFG